VNGTSVHRASIVIAALLALAAFGCGKKPSATAEIDGVRHGKGTGPSGSEATTPAGGDESAWMGQVADVYFDYDRAELRSDARTVLQENGRILKEKAGLRMTLEGHCDERGTEEYNLALGQRRAEAVKVYLANLGIDVSRMEIVSYGEERPFAAGHDEDAWSQNRRVHFRLP
jgi:peptidoglycan-associated lipoprotein